MRSIPIQVLHVWPSVLLGANFEAANLFLRDGAIRCGQCGPVGYRIGPVAGAGLCLDCPLAHELDKPVAVNNLSCGFVVACATTEEHDSLASFLNTFAEWKVAEQTENGQHRIDWQAGGTRMQLVWDEANNRVISQSVDDRPVESQLRYDSPLIRLADGDLPAVVPSVRE